MIFLNTKEYKITQGSVYVEITSRCNLNCPYFYNDSNINGRDLPMEKITDIIDYLLSNGINNMAISGGEPFLHKDIFKILDYANKKNIHVYIVTNASLLSNQVLKKIQPFMNTLDFQFTFDGGKPYTQAITRGIDNFKQIKLCIMYMLGNNYRNNIYLRYNITPFNFLEIDDFINEFTAMGCKYISFSYILQQGRATENSLLTEEQKAKINNVITERKKEIGNDIYLKLSGSPTIICPYAIIRQHQNIVFLPRVTSDGDVFPCQVEVDSKFIIGNIYNNSLEEIMNSQQFKEYIEYISNKQARNKGCKKCILSKICGGGCIAVKNSCNELKTTILKGFLKSENV